MLYRVNENADDESLPLLAFQRNAVSSIFLKYSEEGRSSSRHVGIQVVHSDVFYEFARYQLPFEKKEGARCAKISRDTAVKNLKQIYMILYMF